MKSVPCGLSGLEICIIEVSGAPAETASRAFNIILNITAASLQGKSGWLVALRLLLQQEALSSGFKWVTPHRRPAQKLGQRLLDFRDKVVSATVL